MNNVSLKREQNLNDLGVIVSSDLRWKPLIDQLIKKAKQRLWLVIGTLGRDAPMKAKSLQSAW